MDIKNLSNNHRCFRLKNEDGSSECYFFIGAYHEEKGIRKYGICRMVSEPTAEDIRNITEDTFTDLYLRGWIELL